MMTAFATSATGYTMPNVRAPWSQLARRGFKDGPRMWWLLLAPKEAVQSRSGHPRGYPRDIGSHPLMLVRPQMEAGKLISKRHC